MNSESADEKTLLSEPVPRRFARLILNFFVGLAIGLAPFLGTQKVPFFKALISVMPFQIASKLIVLSAFLMGFIVTAVQFYSAERISRPVLVKRFKIALMTIGVGFLLFYFLRDEYTVDVARGDDTVTVLIGSAPLKSCSCPDPGRNPEACIQRLSFSAPAIAQCWDYREIKHRGELLGLSYLILTSGVGVLVSLILLQQEARRRRTAARRPRPAGRSGGPATPGGSPGSPPAPGSSAL
ncbi:MAG TPA: hypothetical protein VGH73_11730 [Thermoanaerobaculia bacterium]|jgi:hypothetical protein